MLLFSIQRFILIAMCLGIPMQIMEVNGYIARCEAKGVERDVNLFLMQNNPVAVGDFVLVHVGYAIQTITEEHARSAWELYDEMLAATAESPDA
jgi:hydrogenase expression/formation protein HypC